ncbi:MAG TPA: sensor histidine kinase [Pseudonocardiaceae bacterium]
MALLTDAGPGGSPCAAQPSATGLVHEALFYRGLDGDSDPAGHSSYPAIITRFLHEGLERSEPALVAVPGLRLDALRWAMGASSGDVEFVDMAQAGRNPGRILPSVLYAFVRRHPACRVRFVGEPIWPGRSTAEYRAALQHEALINIALEQEQVTILCPYDCVGLDPTALAQARQTHPVLIEGAWRGASTDYRDPRAVADASLRALPEPPEWWGDMLVFSTTADLPRVRAFVLDHARRAGLDEPRASDLCQAVHEVASNTLVHTRGAGVLALWQDPETGSLVCEISDSGQLPSRLVGRIPPAAGEAHGHGLIRVNELCDLVEMPTGQIGTGTTIRLHMNLR